MMFLLGFREAWLMTSAGFVISHRQFSTQLTLLSLKLHRIASTINLKALAWGRRGEAVKWTPSWDFVLKTEKFP